MSLNELNTGLIVKTVLASLATVEGLSGQSVLLQNPDARARFPCAVVSEMLSRQRYGGYSYNLSLKVEVWAKEPYTAWLLSDRARIALGKQNWRPAAPLPEQADVLTGAFRCGSYYECRWHAMENTFEPNR